MGPRPDEQPEAAPEAGIAASRARVGVRAAALGLALLALATGCRSLVPATPLLPDDPRPRALLAAWRAQTAGRQCAARRGALRRRRGGRRRRRRGPGTSRPPAPVAGASGAACGSKCSASSTPTLAVLTTDGERYALASEAEERRFDSGPVYEELLWDVARLDLTPSEAVEVILGAPQPDAELQAEAAFAVGEQVRIELADAERARAPRLRVRQRRRAAPPRAARRGRRSRLGGALRPTTSTLDGTPLRARGRAARRCGRGTRRAAAARRRAESRAPGRYLPAARAGRCGARGGRRMRGVRRRAGLAARARARVVHEQSVSRQRRAGQGALPGALRCPEVARSRRHLQRRATTGSRRTSTRRCSSTTT